MNQRLQQFLSAENLSQSQFADEINVARASVSHILAGRNKPGFDFIESMAKAFPALNIEWLITGKGRMYKSQEANSPVKPIPAPVQDVEPQEDSLFGPEYETPLPSIQTSPEPAAVPIDLAVRKDYDLPKNEPQTPKFTESDTITNKVEILANQKEITKIVVYFSDSTFQEFIPSK